MRPPGMPSLFFAKEKEDNVWPQRQDRSDLTNLRMLVHRIQITQPRRGGESHDGYVRRLTKWLGDNNRTPFEEDKTRRIVDKVVGLPKKRRVIVPDY